MVTEYAENWQAWYQWHGIANRHAGPGRDVEDEEGTHAQAHRAASWKRFELLAQPDRASATRTIIMGQACVRMG